ncbi:hypothetical protein BJ878DRAFT_481401 [Calycina marina]|uniref:SET domain-containing protein n=1 Tax=Calycina marina TaxID=1763456 RepID=A0A9P8CFA0_9HELO|nr:hypothetical protein BJ878DRAFT_481401 [Calycina marina]
MRLGQSKELMEKENRIGGFSYAFRPVDGKGMDLIATSKMPKGTRVLSEAPIFKVPRYTNNNMIEGIIVKGLKRVDEDQQRSISLFTTATESEIFFGAFRINHSCMNNAQNTWNFNKNQLTIHVFKDVEVGEEKPISYFSDTDGSGTRKAILKDNFGFDCDYQLFSLPIEIRQQSGKRLAEITRLDGLIGNGCG